MTTVEITEADEVGRIAHSLIAQYHPHLANAEDVRILYLFTTQERTSHGKPVLASTHRLTPLQRFLESHQMAVAAGADFVILISQERWAGLTPAQQEALVDRELLHIQYDEDRESYYLGPLDFEGAMLDELRRHGAWNHGLQAVAQAFQSRMELVEAGV